MKIGIAAPVETSSIVDLLGSSAEQAPAGYPGAPLIGVLARALIANGHQVSLYTTDSSLLPSQLQPQVIHGDQISVYYCPSRQRSFRPQNGMPGRMLDYFKFERHGLLEAITQDKPDVIHGHWAYEFAWAAIDSKLPNIISLHDSPRQILRHMPNLYRLGRYFMARRTVREARCLTTVSPYMQQEILDWCGRSMELVPNPIADDWFLSARPIEGRDLNQPKIAMVINGWSSRKNPEPALRAFIRVRKKFPNAQLHLFGKDFGLNERAQEWCISKKIEENMVFHGMVPYDQLRSNLAQMTLLVHPALEESFGMSLAEAMALALPVIGGLTSGAVPWVCDGGKAGALVDVGSDQSIADAVLTILSSPLQYAATAQIAQHSSRSRFSVAAVTKAFEACYAQAIAEGNCRC